MKLQETFAVLKPDLAVKPMPVTPTFYEELDERFGGFKNHVLISSYEFTSDWDSWEMHPAGDEVVVLLSGAVNMVQQEDDGKGVVLLDAPGTYVVIPRGVWHTARVLEPATLLFITPGEGTKHRSSAPD